MDKITENYMEAGIIGFYWGNIKDILGIYWDYGKENGN